MSKIKLSKDDRIAIITINRPEVKNALDMETYEEFVNALKEVKEDSEVRVLVITGAGDSFCSGLDLKFAATTSKKTVSETVASLQRLQASFSFEEIEKPVISAVNGYALGNGCDIALASDFIIASEEAKFGMAYTNLGLIPDLGGTFRLPRLVGLAAARELILTGEQIDARRALEIGMISRVVAPENLMVSTMEFADKLAKRAPIAMAMAKTAINKGLGVDLSTSLQFESYLQSICLQSSDMIEAVTALFEKRAPDFSGK